MEPKSKPKDRTRPIDFVCLTCGAEPGMRCMPMSLDRPHLLREKAASDYSRGTRSDFVGGVFDQ